MPDLAILNPTYVIISGTLSQCILCFTVLLLIETRPVTYWVIVWEIFPYRFLCLQILIILYSGFHQLVSPISQICEGNNCLGKRHIFGGFRREYIPGWNKETEGCYQILLQSSDPEIADDLLYSLDAARCKKWKQYTESLNFNKSSRKAWSLLRKLGGVRQPTQTSNVIPDQIGSHCISLQSSKSERIFHYHYLSAVRLSTLVPSL